MMCLLTRRVSCRYIAPKFPKLLITSYNFVQEYCSQEITVRAAETNFNMIRQVTTPIKPETKGTGSIPARNAMIPARNVMILARKAMLPMTTVAGRAAAGPAGPNAVAAKGRAGPALVGKANYRKAAVGPAVGNVSSGASRVAPVIPERAAARPTGGNMGPANGHVGSTPGRVIHAPRVLPRHGQAQQVCSSACSHTHKSLNLT